MRRYALLLAFVLFPLILNGCSESTTNVEFKENSEVRLAPFQSSQLEIFMCNACRWENTMTIYAPVGVTPAVDVVSSSSAVAITSVYRVATDPVDCPPSCGRVAWIINIAIMAQRPGDALVTATLRENPKEHSSFSVRVREQPTKG